MRSLFVFFLEMPWYWDLQRFAGFDGRYRDLSGVFCLALLNAHEICCSPWFMIPFFSGVWLWLDIWLFYAARLCCDCIFMSHYCIMLFRVRMRVLANTRTLQTSRIMQVRSKLYDLLTHCIPATVILKVRFVIITIPQYFLSIFPSS
jgi:hypothetical protein